jgi:polysaccharide biosynthesis protein PslH
MNVLIVTMTLPYPPLGGGAIRVHGITEGLHQAGHQVTLLCFDDDDSSTPEHIDVYTVPPPQRSKIDRLRTLLMSSQPDIAQRFYDETFAERLRDLLAAHTYDLIQFEGIESICYLPIAQAAQPEATLCFDTFNAEYILQRNIFQIDRGKPHRWPAALYSWIQSRRIEHYERAMCQRSDLVVAVSDEDAELLRLLHPGGETAVVPNGIWVAPYQSEAMSKAEGRRLVFTGTMDYRPNVDAVLWFAEMVYPHVEDAEFFIVGQRPHPRLDALREINGVTITGRVDSVLPHLQGAAVYVAPLRMGSGTRLKLLEAMAAGCPIVATNAASAGLNDAVRACMQITDDPHEMATTINTLLDHPAQRAAHIEAARVQVRQHYDWSTLIPRLLAAYQNAGLEV